MYIDHCESSRSSQYANSKNKDQSSKITECNYKSWLYIPNCRSLSKQEDSASLGMRWGRIPHWTLTEPSEYQSPWSPTTHLASFCGSRLAASQPWPECCMVTCSESNTLEALHGDCYAPVSGMHPMVMMMIYQHTTKMAYVEANDKNML